MNLRNERRTEIRELNEDSNGPSFKTPFAFRDFFPPLTTGIVVSSIFIPHCWVNSHDRLHRIFFVNRQKRVGRQLFGASLVE